MSYCDELFGLEGKTVAVTGGGGMIAGALTEALLKAGANVALWSIRTESAQVTVDRVSPIPGAKERLRNLQADTGDEESVRSALERTTKDFGRLDVLINAVGGNRGKGPFVDMDVKTLEEVLRLNLVAGLVVPTKVVASYWIENKIKGNIVNMASMTSYIPLSGVWAYDAAKSGVMNLTMATAKEFAPYGIRVNAMAPGFFIGKQNRALLIDEKSGDLTDRGKAVIGHTPFGRFGDVSELAGALLFLVNDQAAGFVTGVTVPVDGGYLVDNI